jgi:hypothetical protein
MHDPRPRHAVALALLLVLAWGGLCGCPARLWAVTPERMTPVVRAVRDASPAVVNVK